MLADTAQSEVEASEITPLSRVPPAEAIHLGSLVAANGYIFPISDHVLTLKDDGTLYRFQVGQFWNKMMGIFIKGS